MKTVRNFAAVLFAVVALAWVSTFAVAPSILPDFLRPARGWRDLVPNFFTPASATAIGVPPVQGAPGMFPFSIASPADTSPGATSISTNCTSINACSAGSFAQIDVTGQVASGFKCVHSTFSGTLVGDCSGDGGTSWVNGFLVTATGPAASVVVAASSATDNYGIACISLGKVNKVRIRNTVSPTNTTSCTPTTGTYADQGSIFADAASPPNLNQDLQRIAGTAVSTGTGAGGAGIPRFTVSNDSQVKPWDGTNTETVKAATTAAATGDTAAVVAQSPNPSPQCTSFIAINQTAGATVITGTASQKIYICSIALVSATAQNVGVIEGTGTVCASGTPIGVLGGTTASMAFGANGGVAMTSPQPFFKGRTAADNICVVQSGAGNVSGGIFYVSAP